jgi:acyl carrier protein
MTVSRFRTATAFNPRHHKATPDSALFDIHHTTRSPALNMTTLTASDALDAIYQTIDEVNRQLPRASALAKSPGTVLTGEGGALDSLGLITLLVGIEEALQSKGFQLAVLDEDALAEAGGPYRTVGSLRDWLVAKSGQ